MSARRRSRLRLALLLFALLVGAGELVVRLLGLVDVQRGIASAHQAAFNAAHPFVSVSDAALSYRNRPDLDVQVDAVRYAHDARGRRVGPRHAPELPAVAFLGDSTTYGLGLPAEQTLPEQVALALGGAIRPLNYGTCGYATLQEGRLYEAEREQLGDCPLVVLVFFPNDFARGSFHWDEELSALYVDPFPLPHRVQGWAFRSALYRAALSARTGHLTRQGYFDARHPDNRPESLEALTRLARAVAEDGRRLLVAHLPAMEALDPYLFAEPIAELAAHCDAAGILFVDLLPAFLVERERLAAEYAERSGRPVDPQLLAGFLSRYWIDDPTDHHLDAEANAIAARALAAALAPLLPAR